MMTSSLTKELSDDKYFEGGGPEFRKTLKQIGKDGWIGLSWPKEFGGKEFTPTEQYIFVEEVMRTSSLSFFNNRISWTNDCKIWRSGQKRILQQVF
ncbi:MAG: hypothetical protein CM15mP126_3390 [Gammaproteobacteria bacterium]|nr:MAG: hypothetical protein CM15mP126_3390 [Gammaproteobacteria bacterium]